MSLRPKALALLLIAFIPGGYLVRVSAGQSQSGPSTTDCKTAECFTPRTDKEVAIMRRRLLYVMQSEIADYLDESSAIRKRMDVPESEELHQFLNGSDLSSTEPFPKGRARNVSFQPALNLGVAGFLAASCERLASKLGVIGLDGLAAYVMKVRFDVMSDHNRSRPGFAAESFAKVDHAYETLANMKDRLTVSPLIRSVPPGVAIQIFSKMRVSESEYEINGFTDTKATNIYRGIYSYRIILKNKASMGQLNLIDNEGSVITCNESPDQEHIFCQTQ